MRIGRGKKASSQRSNRKKESGKVAKLTRQEKETVVVFNEADEDAEVSTYNRRWVNRLNELVELEVAEELEDEAEEAGSRTFLMPKRLLFPRKPRKQREWTDEQRAEVGARFAAAREEAEEEEEEAPAPKRRARAKAKPKAKPKAKKRATKRKAVVVEEEDDDYEDFDEEEEEETVVQKPARRRRRRTAS